MTRHRGRGIASVNYPIGMNLGGDPSQALVHSNPSGKFTVALSSIDLGQGMKSVTRQICAETLGVPVEDVYVEVEIAPNTRVRVVKATLTEVLNPTAKPAND